jgi:predicted PurR-regulated permease PerM
MVIIKSSTTAVSVLFIAPIFISSIVTISGLAQSQSMNQSMNNVDDDSANQTMKNMRQESNHILKEMRQSANQTDEAILGIANNFVANISEVAKELGTNVTEGVKNLVENIEKNYKI